MTDDFPARLARCRAALHDLGALLDGYRPLLRAIAERDLPAKLASKADAQDLVQDTYMRAFVGFGSFLGESEPELRGWLTTILHNRILNWIRLNGADKRGREVGMPQPGDSEAGWLLEGVPAPDHTPSSQARRNEHATLLHQALERLEPDHRRAITLKFIEGRSHEEVGEALGRSAEAARKLCFRARQELNELLKQRFGMAAGPDAKA